MGSDFIFRLQFSAKPALYIPMPISHQQPLTAPRGRSEHDFSQRYPEWEAAVFDRALYFAVFEMRNGRRETRFETFPRAAEYARVHPDDGPCVYAVAATGRFTHLDREKWDEWEQRWRESMAKPFDVKVVWGMPGSDLTRSSIIKTWASTEQIALSIARQSVQYEIHKNAVIRSLTIVEGVES